MNENSLNSYGQIRGIVRNFMDNPEARRILVLTGPFGQCMREVVKSAVREVGEPVVQEAIENAIADIFTVLSPTSRITYSIGLQNPRLPEGTNSGAETFLRENQPIKIKSKSVYGMLYDRIRRFDEKEKVFVYDLVKNEDSKHLLYIIGDAHLIGNSYREADGQRFGSGYLMDDLMSFVDFSGSQRQMIFIGDPYQIQLSGSSILRLLSKLREFSESVQYERLEDFKCTQYPDPFLKNRESLVKAIQSRETKRFPLSLNAKNCIQLSNLPGDIDQLVKNQNATVAAHTHEQVNQYNEGIRHRAFGRGPELTEEDLIVTYKSIRFTCEKCSKNSDQNKDINVPNGSFGVVTKILGTETIIQSLSGREKPVDVKFIRIRIRWKKIDYDHDSEFLCFEDFLYAEKPKLGRDISLAVRVYTEKWANIRKYAQEQINLTREHWKLTLEYAKTQIRELDSVCPKIQNIANICRFESV